MNLDIDRRISTCDHIRLPWGNQSVANSPRLCIVLLLVTLLNIPFSEATAQLISHETRVSTGASLDFDPDVAAHGDHLVAVWTRDANGAIASAYSQDAGQTWINAGALQPPPGVRRTHAMPTLCVDNSGNFYASAVVYLNFPPGGMNVMVWRGVFQGAEFSWQTGVQALPICGTSFVSTSNPCYDMPRIECDPVSGSLYLSYTLAEAYSFDDIRDTIYFVRSVDSGQTWSSPQPLSTAASNGSRVAVASSGHVFVVWVDFLSSKIVGRKSLNGGITFDSEFVVAPFINNLGSGPPEYRMLGGRQNPIFGYCHWHGTAAQDFPSIAIDRSGGAMDGILYVSWAERASGSVSAGTFPVTELESNDWFATADSIEIGQDILGRIEGEGFGSPDIFSFEGTAGATLWLRAEMQFADTFSEAPPCNSFNIYCADDTLHRLASGTMQELYRGFLPPVIVTLPKTTRYFIVVHESSFTNDYVLHPRIYTPDNGTPARDHRDIVMVRSLDGGTTWSSKVLVNDDPPRFDNSFPEIAVDAIGVVHAIWYDRRDDLIGRHANTYWSRSLDGTSFLPAERLSSQSSPWNYGISGGPGSNIGDHMGLAVAGERVHALWTQRGRPDVDIYSVRISPDPVGITVTEFTAYPGEEAIRLDWRLQEPATAVLFKVYRNERFQDPVVLTQIGVSSNQSEYSFVDWQAVPGTAYEYQLELVSRSGESSWFGPIQATLPVATDLRWLSNSPNPFVQSTQLTLLGVAHEYTLVSVFDVAGRKITDLFHEANPSGAITIIWDGMDQHGKKTRAGVYVVRAQQGGRTVSTKILKMQ